MVKINIRPDDVNMRSVSAADFVGQDDTGTFIYKDSKLDTWIRRIFNSGDLSSVTLDSLTGKKCIFAIEKSEPEGKLDKDGKQAVYFNVSDILSLPVGAVIATTEKPAPVATKPVEKVQESKVPVAVSAAKVEVKATAPASDDWSNGAIL
jgi:hypothetical protein